jgi:lipoprotein-releasing system permease protein
MSGSKGRFPFYRGMHNFVGRGGRISPHLLGSILGIALSLIPLVVVLEVADGMIEGITRRYLEVGTYHLQVNLAAGTNQERFLNLAERLRGREGVQEVIIERQGMGMLYTSRGRTAVTVRAVPPTLYDADAGFRRYFSLTQGSFNLSERDMVVIGREVARKLDVALGEQVKLLTGVSVAGRSLPRITTLRVTGIFSTGYQELDKLWIYLPLRTGIRVLPEDSSTQFLGIKVKDPFAAITQQARRLQADLPADARVSSWFELEKANYKSFQTTRVLLLFIMALIVVVATINISSALVMIVLEKTGEIGILKAIGAHPRDVGLAFLFTGLLTGIGGVLLGLGLGLMLAVNINGILRGLEVVVNLIVNGYRVLAAPLGWVGSGASVRVFNAEFYLEEIPIRIEAAEISVVAALTLLLAALAAFFPARSAARIKPIDVLRKI